MNKVNDILKKLQGKYGKEEMNTLNGDRNKIERIPTGSIGVDVITGGGWPIGRVIEIFGEESTSKTTLAMSCIKGLQDQEKICAFLDVESSYDPLYAESLGINNDNLIFPQLDTAERWLESIEDLVNTKSVDLIILDSVAALVTGDELHGDMGKSHLGTTARLMSQFFRKVTTIAQRNNTTLIFINQLREKIGVMFGNPKVTTGGNALKFYSSVRLDLRSGGNPLKDKNGITVAKPIKAVCKKNKTAPPFQQCTYDVEFGVGINKFKEAIDIGSDLEIVKKSGSWYSYNKIKLGQGGLNAAQFLEDNYELFEEIKNKIYVESGLHSS